MRTERFLFVVTACAAALLIFGASAAVAQSTLRKGMPISEARAELLRQGWVPVRVDKKLADGERENLDAEARLLFEAGFFEVEYCTGTGLNYCSFNYQRRGECLRINTQGEYFSAAEVPTLTRWTNECPD